MKTGKGRPKARVLVADAGQVVLEAETGADGVLLHDWSTSRARPIAGCTYLVLDGADVAGSGLGVPGQGRAGAHARAPTSTPTGPPTGRASRSRSGAWSARSRAASTPTSPGRAYRLEVTDSRGRQIVARGVTLSEFGTFHETLPLDAAPRSGPTGSALYQPGKSDFAGAFEVQSYQLEPIDLAFDLKKTVFYRGETVEADVVARYQYGARWPAGRSRSRCPTAASLTRHDRRRRQVPRRVPDRGLRRGAGPATRRPAAPGQRRRPSPACCWPSAASPSA